MIAPLSKPHAVEVVGTNLQVAAYATMRGDLCIAINDGRLCLGRIVLEGLCQLDLKNATGAVVDLVLAPIPEARRKP